jgi:hypothetical protein
MDWRTLIVDLVKALAWPITTLIIIRIFRMPLLEILPMIRSFKIPGLEVLIAREIAEVKALAPHSGLKGLPPKLEQVRHRLYSMAAWTQRGAISEAWGEIEVAGGELVSRHVKDSPAALRTPASLPELLRNKELITKDQNILMTKLRKIRNEAVGGRDFFLDETSVYDYINSSLALAEELRNCK